MIVGGDNGGDNGIIVAYIEYLIDIVSHGGLDGRYGIILVNIIKYIEDDQMIKFRLYYYYILGELDRLGVNYLTYDSFVRDFRIFIILDKCN